MMGDEECPINLGRIPSDLATLEERYDGEEGESSEEEANEVTPCIYISMYDRFLCGSTPCQTRLITTSSRTIIIIIINPSICVNFFINLLICLDDRRNVALLRTLPAS